MLSVPAEQIDENSVSQKEMSRTAARRRWPWILLLILLIVMSFGVKVAIQKAARRERLRVWKLELESLGLQAASVTVGDLPIIGRSEFVDQLFLGDSIAVFLLSDQMAEMLVGMKSPAPDHLTLIDSGLSSEMKTRLLTRFPTVKLPRIPAPPLPAPSPLLTPQGP